MTEPTTRLERMQQRYRNGDIPWDHELPPPEVIAIAERLPAGRLLDLGCGTARASVYLAARGWQADAVDFVPEAIAMAQERIQAAGLEQHVHGYVGSVTNLHFLNAAYDLAIDVGFFHGLEAADQHTYAQELAGLMRPGGLYMLYVHLGRLEQESGATGVPIERVEIVFGKYFEIVHVEYGKTIMAELQCDSAWYELKRL